MRMSTSQEEEVPFLEKTSEGVEYKRPTSNKTQNSKFVFGRGITIIAALLLINVIVLIVNCRILAVKHRTSGPDILSGPYSPADDAVKYEIRTDHYHETGSPYSGKPRPAFDKAWYDLLYHTNIEVTPDELRAANKTSLKLEGSANYLAYLEVYHQLHCIKRMVQMRYPEYYPSLVARGKLTEEHFDHCIEVLRQGAMCRADTSLVTLDWDDSKPQQIVAAQHGPKMCVSWDRILDWVRPRFPGEHYKIAKEDGKGVIGPSD